jgi:Protein of unknown function (DUF3052)
VAAGYSGTPLAKKLGIGSSTRVFLSGAPKRYLDLIAPVPEGARIVRKIDDATDIVHVFATDRVRLAALLRSSLAKLRPDAAIWVSWPKKSSKVPSDITENTIRELALPMGLVDIKVCAVDDTWSGLKLVVRKQNRRKGVP